MFITFEGPDGSGKSTQARLLCEKFIKKGHKVTLTREPGGTELGRSIRSILLDPSSDIAPMAEVFLYAADRAQHVQKVISPALKEGKVVICDRYFDSNVAYQGSLSLDIDDILAINKHAISNVLPDITFLLDIDPRVGLSRATGINEKEKNETISNAAKGDRIERRDIDFHVRVRENFLRLSDVYKDRYAVINVEEKSPQTVHEEIVGVLEMRLFV